MGQIDDGLSRYLESKQSDRNEYTHKKGWSKWSLTNKGDDKQGWIRWNNQPSEMSFETARQIVFAKNGKFRIVDASDSELKYGMFSFDTAEEAMMAAKEFTSQVSFMTNDCEFDNIRYAAYKNCINNNPPEHDEHHYELDKIKGHREELMTKEENDEFRMGYASLFMEPEPYVIEVNPGDPVF